MLTLTGRRRPALAAATLIVAAGAAVAGCGSSGDAASGTPAAASSSAASSPGTGSGTSQQVTITGTSRLRFSPSTVRVHPGAVTITLKDMGSYPHNIVIPALHKTSKTVTGDPGGGSTSFTVRFSKAGHYPFHCQYHQSAGMTGVFVVS